MEMPQDWNDHQGWDEYYRTHQPDLKNLSDYDIQDSLRYFSAGQNGKVWISGCGVELSPWLFSNLNTQVLATDASSVAVEFQHRLMQESPFETLKNLDSVLEGMKLTPTKKFIKPEIRVEDFRHTAPGEKFDVVLNVKAIQGLPVDDIKKAAKIFFDSTAEGGIFLAATMNVQGPRRTEIENAFSSAGYIVPNAKAEQWYRKKLDETGILYVMVLGNPIIPQWDQYENKGGKEQEEKDKEILRSFRDEYSELRKQNYEEDKKNYRPDIDKLAYIIYNTG